MTLTYWVAPCLGDSACYNIRAKTRKQCIALANEARDFERNKDGSWGSDYNGIGKPQKHTIHYDNAFDLMEQCLSDERGSEPS